MSFPKLWAKLGRWRWISYGAIALLTSGLVTLTPQVGSSVGAWLQPLGNLIGSQPVLAQSAGPRAIRPQDVAKMVYDAMPDLPREDQYVSDYTGEVSEDNTLVSRLIRYHLYVAGRPANYRLDWKLTLADYLGVNDWVQDSTYPGADSLRQNPRDGDVAAIQGLNRAQRDMLATTLANIYSEFAAQGAIGLP